MNIINLGEVFNIEDYESKRNALIIMKELFH
jgi:hypothetical protein